MKRKHRKRRPSGKQRKINREMLADILESQGGRCFYCPNLSTTVDHLIPLSQNGAYGSSNIVGACKGCNEEKGDRMPTGEEITLFIKQTEAIRNSELRYARIRNTIAIIKYLHKDLESAIPRWFIDQPFPRKHPPLLR